MRSIALTLEEQRLRDEDAIYDRYVDPECYEHGLTDCPACGPRCEHPDCDEMAVGLAYVDDIVGEMPYCARHIGVADVARPTLSELTDAEAQAAGLTTVTRLGSVEELPRRPVQWHYGRRVVPQAKES